MTEIALRIRKERTIRAQRRERGPTAHLRLAQVRRMGQVAHHGDQP
jgi:hypothetical protein